MLPTKVSSRMLRPSHIAGRRRKVYRIITLRKLWPLCETFRMSEQPVTQAGLPKWDLADKMRKSLRHAGLGVAEMADYLDVDRSTVSTWINARIEPSARVVQLWALRTGIPYTWYCHGDL